MPQRIIAIDITDSELKAAVLQTTFRDYRIEGLYRRPLDSDDGDAATQVRAFSAEHVKSGDTVLSALPGDLVTWRTFYLPFRDQKRLGQTVPFELEGNVPFGLDEVIVDYQVLHRDRAGTLVLAALVEKPELQKHLELLKQAGIDPKVVDLAPLTALNTLNLVANLPPTFVFLDVANRTTSLAFYRNGELAGLRTLTRAGSLRGGNGAAPGTAPSTADAGSLADEVRWTLLALNGAPLDERLPCFLAGDPSCIAALEQALGDRISLEIRGLDRLELRNLGTEKSAEAPRFSTSLGLALREAQPGDSLGINFRRGEFTFHRSQQELQRALRGVAALAAIVVALTVGDLYMEYRQLAARARSIEDQIQYVFTQTIPDAGRVADPVAQLQAEISALQERTTQVNDIVPVSSLTSVDILRTISTAVPNKIRIDAEDYNMDPDAVRLRANTDTFESVDTIKQGLLDTGFFRDVQVKDAKAGKDGNGVDFRMNVFLNKDFRPRGGENR